MILQIQQSYVWKVGQCWALSYDVSLQGLLVSGENRHAASLVLDFAADQARKFSFCMYSDFTQCQAFSSRNF